MNHHHFPRALKAWSLLFLAATTLAEAAGTIRIDFGRSDTTNGSTTQSPDLNGKYWNNIASPATAVPNGWAYANLVNTSNVRTGIGVTFLGANWQSNGRNHGGLLAPGAALLGELAVASATEDYYFVNGGVGRMKISGLDPGRLYTFRMFGTRNATDVRSTTYSIVDGTGAHTVTLQTSGDNIGNDGSYDGNDKNIAELTGIQSDASGNVDFRLIIASGAFAYLGVMEIIEGNAAAPLSDVSRVVRVDFGRSDGTNGNVTTSPDVNGVHWNNLSSTFNVANGQTSGDMVTTQNIPSGISLTMQGASWEANGRNNGGLKAPNGPNPSLLGGLAGETATEDYYFVESGVGGGVGTMLVSGLDPLRTYTFRMFGTRESTSTRTSIYTITDGTGDKSATLQTSGDNIGSNGTYDGNDDEIAQIANVQANASGEVQFKLSISNGGFAYLGAMEIVRGNLVPALAATAPSSVSHWVSQDLIDPPAQGSLVFLGSSSIRRWESVTRDFAEYKVIQRGYGGALITDLTPMVPWVVAPYQPSAVVVWGGTNDLTAGRSGMQVHADFTNFLNTLRKHLPTVPFFYLGITPTPANSATTAERQVANTLIQATIGTDPHSHYIDLPAYFNSLSPIELEDLHVDPVHLNRAGYAAWLNLVRPAVQAVVPPNKPAFSNPSAPVAGDELFFDLGPDDVLSLDGNETPSPDANGHHWNHWYPVNGGVTIHSGEHKAGLINSSGAPTGLKWIITGGYQVNGLRNGGLFTPNGPNPSLLGDLAINTATQDYFYSTADDLDGGGDDDLPGGFMLSGLNPALTYEFHFFGSRENTATRRTEYAVYGADRRAAVLTTSGTDIGNNGAYDGNDDEIVVVSGVRPDAFGQVFIDMLSLEGGFAYLNAMKIIVSGSSTGIPAWRSLHFTSEELGNPALEASLWGNEADPDGDGRSNLIEYATGTDPRVSEVSPVSATHDAGALSLTYTKNLAASDIAFQVQQTDDLAAWNDISDVRVSIDDNLETRRATVATAGEPKQWLRLRVLLGSQL